MRRSEILMIRAFFLFVLTCSCVSCSRPTLHLELFYDHSLYDGGPIAQTRPSVCVLPVVDTRSDKSRVGIQKDTMFGEIGDIKSSNVTSWCQNAIAIELRASGFTVIQVKHSEIQKERIGECDLVVAPKLRKAFIEPLLRLIPPSAVMQSNVDLDLIVSYEGSSYIKRYRAVSNQDSKPMGTLVGENVMCLNDALSKIAVIIPRDLSELLRERRLP